MIGLARTNHFRHTHVVLISLSSNDVPLETKKLCRLMELRKLEGATVLKASWVLLVIKLNGYRFRYQLVVNNIK